MERADNRTSAITIYWQTKNKRTIKAIVERFEMPKCMSINRETECIIRSNDLRLLQECEKRGFIQIRNKKNNYEKRINS